MAKHVKRRSQKAGLPPGTLVHIGRERTQGVKITAIEYSPETYQELVLGIEEACALKKEKGVVTWIDVEGINQVDVLSRLGECFNIHSLVLEDILNTNQRPKVEDYGDYLYIVLKMLYAKSDGIDITTEQVSIILGETYVISFQEGIEGDTFNGIREHLKVATGRLRSMGADYLAYTLIDSVVDNYFAIMEMLGEEVDDLEDELVASPERQTLESIHNLKSTMIFLRRSVWPLREVIGTLERGESRLIQPSSRIYLRDVYDHTIQVIDTIETYRDMLSGMVDIYLSSVSNRLNEVMKVLTIVSTIFIPLTFIVGLYGMNFRYMPELSSRWGYPVVLLIMLLVALSMVMYFRRKKWI
ncbi:MAG TPA: magnesium/cobalt transporter CorA [Candidatus Aquicultor sp.]|jgi:magnesium transporter